MSGTYKFIYIHMCLILLFKIINITLTLIVLLLKRLKIILLIIHIVKSITTQNSQSFKAKPCAVAVDD